MTKYIRSKAQLFLLIKQVFGVSGVSMDTKLLVLVLAGTMSRGKFNRWLDKIPQLNAFNAQYKQINALRHTFGADFRNYIIESAFHCANDPVNDSELQQFIQSDGQNELPPLQDSGVDLSVLDRDVSAYAHEQTFYTAVQAAIAHLNASFNGGVINDNQVIVTSYLMCRKYAQPSIAAYALKQAIYTILISNNVADIRATIESKKLVRHALMPIVDTSTDHKVILYKFTNS